MEAKNMEPEEKVTTTSSASAKYHSKEMHGEHEEPIEHVKSYFAKELPDEIHGCCKYLDLAKMAEDAGEAELAHGLYEMARDEYTHAKFIHDHLIDWGCEIPQEEVTKYHQMKERIFRIFQ
ncbi:MAG: hypothetical protein K2O54_04540 [Prevotella sp.]|nr:hypothetical protein [Prevotella sp.]